MAPAQPLDALLAAGTESANVELDLEAVITWFAGDDSCMSHALPTSLSAEQRQYSKQIAKRFPNLDCESYGFGAERQLHLFKKRAHGFRTRVKNTFIDAWVEAAEHNSSSTPLARSLPSDLRNIAETFVVPITPKLRPSLLGSLSNPLGEGEHELMCSTPSPCLSPKYLGCSEAPSLIIQSSQPKPRCEPPLIDADAFGFAPTAPPPMSPGNVAVLPAGTAVEIDGLLRRPDFNGAAGIVMSWDATMRRYNILLEGGEVQRQVKAKRENLRLRTPPPPSSSAVASLQLDTCIPICSADATRDLIEVRDETQWSAPLSDAQAWIAWQFCDNGIQINIEDLAGASPLSDLSSTASFCWEEQLSDTSTMSPFNGIDGIDNATWVLQHGCDTQFAQGAWHRFLLPS